MTAVVVELAQTASGVAHALWLTILSQISGDRLAIEGKTPYYVVSVMLLTNES
jgi:hypothetical protein